MIRGFARELRAVGNISELACALDCHAMAEIRECIPLHNDYAVSALVNSGACGVWLNSELTLAEIAHIAKMPRFPWGIWSVAAYAP